MLSRALVARSANLQATATATPAVAAARPMSTIGNFAVPTPTNEPMLNYAPGSTERKNLREALTRLQSERPELPCIVGGEEIHTGDVHTQTMPTNHSHALCDWHAATPDVLNQAVDAAMAAKKDWAALPIEDRAGVFLKAADLLSTKYRAEVCAATMLGVGKNIWQAEIDAAAECIDFFRFSAGYAADLYSMQPPCNDFGVWNRMEYRPLEGFVLAICPFNFNAIQANLALAPAIMGNTVVWKPSETAILGAHVVYKVLKEAGLPDGVINFVPAPGATVGNTLIPHRDLGGLHFTGSTATFNHLWREVGANLENYKSYPRVVGETGGKNFHLIHPSADMHTAVHQTVRGAFEYQGQKCSATSRLYVPSSAWPAFKEDLVSAVSTIKQGCVTEFDTFVAAVIDDRAFKKITGYIEGARNDSSCEIIAGGGYDDSTGYFVEPTVIVTTDPHSTTMEEEIFGPVLTVYVYDDSEWDATVDLVNSTSKYALTGSIFAKDRLVIAETANKLKDASGNFYINDKSTGAVVGQQPFGGSRQSGTNDKSGSSLNLLRWVSVRSTKEQYLPLAHYGYPSLSTEA